jgi:transposase-like protein
LPETTGIKKVRLKMNTTTRKAKKTVRPSLKEVARYKCNDCGVNFAIFGDPGAGAWRGADGRCPLMRGSRRDDARRCAQRFDDLGWLF